MNKKGIVWQQILPALLMVIVLIVVIFVYIKPLAEGGSEIGKCENQGGTCEFSGQTCPPESIPLYGFECEKDGKEYPCCRAK